jgi:DNA-binding beta-propeller fold protein YncE
MKALSDRNLRSAIVQIWQNRDYTQYGEVENRDMSLPNWTPSARMRLYIRKDVAAQIWNYGVAPSAEELGPQDPFTEDKRLELSADKVIGIPGSEPGQFQRPRDLAVAPDGSLYVADTENHRIQHLSSNGEVLQVWGQFGDLAQGSAPDGTFNQPWGIAVSPDGSVFVADTWNHRIQKFTAQGKFITKWGYFGQAEAPDAFWGPRDVAVDTQGRVFVTDTGNKRVVVFDGDGNYLAQFGTTGFNAGEFDEPVGLAIDQAGRIFVADTWNQRIQVFTETDKNVFVPSGAWELVAWFGQSLDNKPYLAVDDKGNVFAVEPEGYRILWFSDTGEALYYWGDYGIGPNQFGMPGSIAYDHQGGVWVTDTGNGRLMHFTLPVTKGPGSE